MQTIAEQFALFESAEFLPRYNIAPTQPAPVVRWRPDDARRQLVLLRWGLVPSWAKAADIGSQLINARAETLTEKPAFRAAIKRRRCLIVADGFYEWQREGSRKQPFFIHRRDDQPFALAGLWESWERADHSALETCTIVTCAPNDVLRPLHDRMPAILPPTAYEPWLDASHPPEAVLPLLGPCPADDLEAFAVEAIVNSPKHDDPRCIERQRTLF